MTIIFRAEEFVYQGVENGELEIDCQGCIWRLARRHWSRWTKSVVSRPCKRCRAEANTGAYYAVYYTVDGKKMGAQASRLVWKHFNGAIPIGLTINHKNGNKKDNRPSNLELATRAEQQLHAIRYLGWKPQRNWKQTDFRGSNNGRAKLNNKKVLQIRGSKQPCTALAKKYGVTASIISGIRLGIYWRHV